MCDSKLDAQNNFSARANQKGQAIVEYMMVLIVVVAIILGAIYQLNNSFKIWANAYFGEYVTCLLETGELPTLGGTQAGGECLTPKFVAPKLADGADGSSSNGEGSDSDSSNSKGKGGGKSVADGDGSGSSGSQAALQGTSSRFRIKRVRGSSDGDEGGSGESISMLSSSGVGNSAYYNSNDGRPQRIRITYSFARRGKKEKEDEKKIQKSKSVEKGQRAESGPVLMRVDARNLAQVKEIDMKPPGFGDYLRYLIIIAIVMLVVLFIGGQALQITKSMD
jgi:hypothetical protein